MAIFLFGLFWLCLWQTKWRIVGIGIRIILISFGFMLNSPKPDLIVDINLGALALRIMKACFKFMQIKCRLLISNIGLIGLGKKIVRCYLLSEGVFSISSGQKVAINCDNKKCNLSNIQINILDRNGFIDEHIKLDREFLEMAGVVVIFCDSNNCRLKYDNARFIYRR